MMLKETERANGKKDRQKQNIKRRNERKKH